MSFIVLGGPGTVLHRWEKEGGEEGLLPFRLRKKKKGIAEAAAGLSSAHRPERKGERVGCVDPDRGKEKEGSCLADGHPVAHGHDRLGKKRKKGKGNDYPSLHKGGGRRSPLQSPPAYRLPLRSRKKGEEERKGHPFYHDGNGGGLRRGKRRLLSNR